MEQPQVEPDLPVSFSAFVVSLAQSAVLHLGETPDPVSGKIEQNFVLARNTIDLLGMLKDKTKGNLDDDEQRLMDALLYELRSKFVAKVKK